VRPVPAKILASCTGLVVALLLGELLVRGLGLAPAVAFLQARRFRLSDNPRIGYEPLAGPLAEAAAGADGLPLNAQGFRDRDHTLDKRPGSLRVAVLGDSIAAGLGVDRFEDTFPAVLERSLRAAPLDAEVLSFAVVGYNTMQEVALFEERGLAYRPDVVVVAYCLNDVERNDGQLLDGLLAAEADRRSLDAAPWRRRLAASALYRLVAYRLLHERPAVPEELRRRYAVLYENTVLPSLTRLAELGREHGFDVVLVVFPYFADLFDYDSRYAVLHDYLRRHSANIGAGYLDLLPVLRGCGDPPGRRVARDTLHPSATGHRCAGEAAARFIAARVLRRDQELHLQRGQ